MSVEIRKMDVLDAPKGSCVVHQVNCKGVMGAGLAAQVKERYPWAYLHYKKIVDFFQQSKAELLGHCIISEPVTVIEKNGKPAIVTVDAPMIAHVFGQDDYGRQRDYTYTDYDALQVGLMEVNANLNPDVDVYIPQGMGAGLGGGDWNFITKLIMKSFPNRNVVICVKE